MGLHEKKKREKKKKGRACVESSARLSFSHIEWLAVAQSLTLSIIMDSANEINVNV